ncbi:hypothetical protein [Cerasicoccus fimbriatus]|uniref:hypothetical protein n=1 Tax=Cerasicoccus fimbriatus TaxID=3014554 RepID=UPI0022B47FB5|nr:hypothetical protein [Cerasicoccus sp. TK19100]
MKHTWLIWFLLPLLLGGQSRTHIGAPIENFRLPSFGEDGNRIWDLRGDKGLYLENGEIEVERMILRTFSPGNPKDADLTIESPKARIYPEENRAAGPGYLFLEASDGSFAIVGRNWQWFNDEQKIVIGEEARVTFKQAIGSILE